jgi:hypothetical protein
LRSHNTDIADFLAIEKNLINIEQALNGLSMLLEEIANKGQDQAQEISWSNSILKLAIRQTEETGDILARFKPRKGKEDD